MSAVRGYAEAAAELARIAEAHAVNPDLAAVTELYREAAVLLAGVAAALPHAPDCLSLLHDFDYRDCDCTKVTVAQMAALWEAVWSDEPMVVHPRGPEPWHWVTAVAEYLRSVRPSPSPKETT